MLDMHVARLSIVCLACEIPLRICIQSLVVRHASPFMSKPSLYCYKDSPPAPCKRTEAPHERRKQTLTDLSSRTYALYIWSQEWLGLNQPTPVSVLKLRLEALICPPRLSLFGKFLMDRPDLLLHIKVLPLPPWLWTALVVMYGSPFPPS